MRSLITQLFSGLRPRLLFLVALASIPPVALTLHTAWQDRQREAEVWKRHSAEVIQLATREEDELIGGIRQLLRAVAESFQVQSGQWAKCDKLLAKLLADDPRYANLGVIKTNGDVLSSALTLAGPINLADRPFFQRALFTRSLSIGDYEVGRITGKPSLNFG